MTWQSGKSGNPAGRTPEDRMVKRLAREHTEAAIRKLAQWMESDNPKASVAAAIALLDRAWGKPKQAVELQDESGLPIGLSVTFGRTAADDRVSPEARMPLSS